MSLLRSLLACGPKQRPSAKQAFAAALMVAPKEVRHAPLVVEAQMLMKADQQKRGVSHSGTESAQPTPARGPTSDLLLQMPQFKTLSSHDNSQAMPSSAAPPSIDDVRMMPSSSPAFLKPVLKVREENEPADEKEDDELSMGHQVSQVAELLPCPPVGAAHRIRRGNWRSFMRGISPFPERVNANEPTPVAPSESFSSTWSIRRLIAHGSALAATGSDTPAEKPASQPDNKVTGPVQNDSAPGFVGGSSGQESIEASVLPGTPTPTPSTPLTMRRWPQFLSRARHLRSFQ